MTVSLHPLLAAAALVTLPVTAARLTLTVNSAGNENFPDDRLTLVEALHVANETLGRTLTAPEAIQVVEEIAGEDLVLRFAIPGEGPHWIAAPPGGFPPLVASRFARALVDGYSQPGALPRGAIGPGSGRNNAVLRIVLDCRVLAPDPVSRIMPDFSFKIARSHTHFRGFSVLASTESDNFGVYFADGAAGGQVSGCWFGVSPDQQILSGGEVAIAAYGTAGGQVFGSDGDGVDDAAEANVIAAHAIGVQFEDTRDILVQGNSIGVLPDGITLPPVEIREALEGDAIEGAGLAGTVTVRRNVIGGMRGDVVEFYGDAERLVIQGNYIGVSGDGVTPLPNGNFLRVQAVQVILGSEVDAPAGTGPANRILNHTGYLFRYGSAGTRIAQRGNYISQYAAPYALGLGNSIAGQRLGRDSDLAPVLSPDFDGKILRGSLPLAGAGGGGPASAWVDLYLAAPGVDPLTPSISVRLATFEEGGPSDLDPASGTFAFDVSAVRGVGTLPHLAATAVMKDATGVDTSPWSNLLQVRDPSRHLSISREGDAVVLNWGDPIYGAQFLFRNLTDTNGWSDIPGGPPVRAPLSLSEAVYFRLMPR
ncbi:MAG: hypothetical protein J0L84_10025 [Verrucomicrobia bacterium]|nr:hypothetical protein [Verrucomicrobiota bacterium]